MQTTVFRNVDETGLGNYRKVQSKWKIWGKGGILIGWEGTIRKEKDLIQRHRLIRLALNKRRAKASLRLKENRMWMCEAFTDGGNHSS